MQLDAKRWSKPSLAFCLRVVVHAVAYDEMQRRRFKELMSKIRAGTATDADNIEVEKLCAVLFPEEESTKTGTQNPTKDLPTRV